MEALISHIDDLAILHDILPGLVKVSLVVLICLAAYVPVSLISWIISVAFQKPIKLGDIVTLEAQVSRAFTSSMEVVMDVWVEDHISGDKKRHNEAIFTFVAVDQIGRPIEVPELMPESDQEKERFEGALRRRQLNLIMAGKMAAKDAVELKSLFQ